MATFTLGNYTIDTANVESGGTTTSITLDFTGAAAGDVLLAIISKDDDVATDGGTGQAAFTLVTGLAGNAQMYLEVWKREATGSETTYTWTGDSEEYAATAMIIQGAAYASLTAATSTQGNDAVPTSPDISPTPDDSLLIAGYGTDQANTPATLNAALTTELCELYSTTGAGSAALHVGGVVWAWNPGYATASASMVTGTNGRSNFGTGAAAVCAAGTNETNGSNISEEYNGTSWSAGNTLSGDRYYAGSTGTQTAGLLWGGEVYTGTLVYLNSTREYDGTTWTSGGNLPAARSEGYGIGTQTDAMQTSGRAETSPNWSTVVTYEYNGSSWSSGGDNLWDMRACAIFGTPSDAINTGGASKTSPGTTQRSIETTSYNGTAWSAENDLSLARSSFAGAGTSSAGYAISGNTLLTGDRETTETWDGTSWSSGKAIPSQRVSVDGSAIGSGGSVTAMVCGGNVVADSVLELSLDPVLTPTLDMAHSISSANDWAAFSLYLGPSSVPRNVTCTTEAMSLTANDVTVSRVSASRTVACTSAAMSLTANDAVVNISEEFRYVNCASEALTLTAPDATVSKVGSVVVDFSDAFSGEALIVVLTIDGTTASTSPAGWTLHRGTNLSTTLRSEIWVRTATGSEGTYEWTHPNAPLLGTGTRLLNVDPASIISAVDSESVVPDAQPVSPTLTANAKGDTIVAGAHVDGDWSGAQRTIELDLQLAGDVAAAASAGNASASQRYGFEYLKSKIIWATDYNMLTAVQGNTATGTQSAGLSWGGDQYAENATRDTEEDNGTAWSLGGDYPVDIRLAHGGGTQTAGISVNGTNPVGGAPGYGYRDEVYDYNGTAWSAGDNSPVYSNNGSGTGTSTSYLNVPERYILSGFEYTYTNSVFDYNGTAWTTEANAFAAGYRRQTRAIVGTGTDAVIWGGAGQFGWTDNTRLLMDYNGSTFSSTGQSVLEDNTASYAAGTTTDGLTTGGTINVSGQPVAVISTLYNGTTLSADTVSSIYATATYGSSSGAATKTGGRSLESGRPTERATENGTKTGKYSHRMTDGKEFWVAWTMAFEADPDRTVNCYPEALGLTAQATVDRVDGLSIVCTPAAMSLTTNPATVLQGVDRTVACTTEVLALTANAATVTQGVDRIVTCTSEALTHTTNAVDVDQGRGVVAQSEALSLTTTAATVQISRDVSADTEALLLTANAAALNKSREVAATTEALALGTNATVVDLNRTAAAAPEALSLTTEPVDVSRVFNRTVSVATEALSLSTLPAGVALDRTVQVATEALSLTAESTTVFRGVDRSVQAAPEALALTANITTVVQGIDRAVQAGTEALSLMAEAAIVFKGVDRTVQAGAEQLTLTTQPVGVDSARDVGSTSAAALLTTQPVGVDAGRLVGALTEAATLTTQPVGVDAAREAAASTEVLQLTTSPVTVFRGLDRTVVATSEALALTANPAQVFKGDNRDVTCSVERLRLTTNTVAVQTDRDVVGDSEALALTAAKTGVGQARGVLGVTEALSLTTTPAALQIDREVTGATEALNLTANAATVDTSTDRSVVSTTAALALTTTPATVDTSTDRVVSAAPSALSLTTVPSTVFKGVDRVVIGATEQLTLTANAATVTTGQNRTVTCSTEALTLTAFPATVETNSPRDVVCAPEALALTAIQTQVTKVTVSNTLPWYGREGVIVMPSTQQVGVLPTQQDNANVLTGGAVEPEPDVGVI